VEPPSNGGSVLGILIQKITPATSTHCNIHADGKRKGEMMEMLEREVSFDNLKRNTNIMRSVCYVNAHAKRKHKRWTGKE
jgi:hypothetical protein